MEIIQPTKFQSKAQVLYLFRCSTHRVRRGLRATPRDVNVEDVENDAAQYQRVSNGFQHFFLESLKYACHKKKGPEASEVFPPATHHASKLANVYKSDACEVFRTSSKFTKYYACHKIWLPKPPLSSQAVKILKCFRITRKIHRSPRTPCETSFENGGHNFFRAFQRPPWINTAKVLQ